MAPDEQIEDVYRREQVERFNQRLREFEEDQRAYRNHHGDRQTESDLVEVWTTQVQVFGHPPFSLFQLEQTRKKMDLSAGHAPH